MRRWRRTCSSRRWRSCARGMSGRSPPGSLPAASGLPLPSARSRWIMSARKGSGEIHWSLPPVISAQRTLAAQGAQAGRDRALQHGSGPQDADLCRADRDAGYPRPAEAGDRDAGSRWQHDPGGSAQGWSIYLPRICPLPGGRAWIKLAAPKMDAMLVNPKAGRDRAWIW